MKSLSLLTNGKSLARHDARGPARGFWRPDCHFQSHADGVAVVPETRSLPARADLRAFRRMSNDYFKHESGREYLIELLVYALVAGLAAWPLISMLMVLAETARG
jgi:hypothetical protein